MEKAKAARLVREKEIFFQHVLGRLREIFKEYSHTLPENHLFPNTADIYFHPIVNAALSVVESHEALEEALAGIQPLLPEIADDCLKLSKQDLANLVVDEYVKENKPFDLSVLTLASTLFYCKDCLCDLTLDQAVIHECGNYFYHTLTEDVAAVRQAIHEVATTHRIRKTMCFSLHRLEPFISILHSCGIDPNTVTATDMDELDPIIECLSCSHIQKGRVTMNWITAVSVQCPRSSSWLRFPRQVNHFQRHPTINAARLDDPEAEIVRARLLEQYQKDTCNEMNYICVRCRDRGGSMTLLRHVKAE
jgi:hypothetical protein